MRCSARQRSTAESSRSRDELVANAIAVSGLVKSFGHTRALSKGNRQKVALVAALASDVELLILDEPTSGLDALMEAVFRACMSAGVRRRDIA